MARPKATKQVKPTEVVENPLLQAATISPAEEQDKIIEAKSQIENLADLSVQLRESRKMAAYEARVKDLSLLKNMEVFMDTVLVTMAENTSLLQAAIKEMLKKKDMVGLSKLMLAFKMTQEAREQILGFDETRLQSKKKLKLQVVWKDAQGNAGGVNLET
ncbi:MAG: hypothetical protein WC958_06165 [Dehalococcoidales bacterium]